MVDEVAVAYLREANALVVLAYSAGGYWRASSTRSNPVVVVSGRTQCSISLRTALPLAWFAEGIQWRPLPGLASHPVMFVSDIVDM